MDTQYKTYDEIINQISTSLKETFTSKQFLYEEDDPKGRGRRYVWKAGSENSNKGILVTIFTQHENNKYELITAYKKWV